MATPQSHAGVWSKVKYAVISQVVAAKGEQIAAVSGKKIRVIGGILNMTGAAGTMEFFSATTAITGVMQLLKDTALPLPESACGYFETAAGENLALTVTTTSAVVTGVLAYIEV